MKEDFRIKSSTYKFNTFSPKNPYLHGRIWRRYIYQAYTRHNTWHLGARRSATGPYFTRRATRNLRKCESRTESGKLRAGALSSEAINYLKQAADGAGSGTPECAPGNGSISSTNGAGR